PADAVPAGVRAAFAYQLRGADADITMKRGDLDDSVLNEVRRLPGVAAAEGRTVISAPLLKDGHAQDAGAVSVPAAAARRPSDVAAGRRPDRPDEARASAEAGYSPGQRVTVFDQDGQ